MPAIPVFGFGTAAPTDTNIYYEAGSYVRNSAPTAQGVAGWVCVTAGSPGTWKAELLDTGAIATGVSAASALATGVVAHIITGASTQTLASAASYATGSKVSIISNNVLVTLTPAASQTLIGNSTITANTGITIISNGVNTWYRTN